jgi:hypothetical protein
LYKCCFSDYFDTATAPNTQNSSFLFAHIIRLLYTLASIKAGGNKMRLKITIALGLFLLALIMAVGIPPQSSVSAETLLQEVPRFENINIYFSETNGEASRFDRSNPGISRLAGLLRQLGANLYSLDWRSRLPADADLVIIAGPLTDLTSDQTARLWSYLADGGHLLLLANPVVETTSAQGLPVASGLFQLLWNDTGIRGRNDVVVTEATATAEATEEPGAPPQGALTARFLTANLNIDHPITANLGTELAFFISRSIEFDAAIQDVNTVPLVFTDDTFYGEVGYAAYLTSGTVTYDVGVDTGRGPLALAAAFDNPASGARFVIIGDREFVTNGAGFQTSPVGSASFLYPGNVRFTLNTLTWLVNKEEVTLALPTPGPTATASTTPTLTPAPTLTPEVPPTATPGA